MLEWEDVDIEAAMLCMYIINRDQQISCRTAIEFKLNYLIIFSFYIRLRFDGEVNSLEYLRFDCNKTISH